MIRAFARGLRGEGLACMSEGGGTAIRRMPVPLPIGPTVPGDEVVMSLVAPPTIAAIYYNTPGVMWLLDAMNGKGTMLCLRQMVSGHPLFR